MLRNEHVASLNVDDAFSVVLFCCCCCFVLFCFSFWSCCRLDNEGIQEDPAGIGREVQREKKSLGGLRDKFEATRTFFSPCCVRKSLMKEKHQLWLSWDNGIAEASELRVISLLHGRISLSLSKCLPRVGAPLLDFTGCFASGLPGFQAPGQCCPRTGRYSRITARKPRLARHLNTTHVWDRPYLTRILLWSWPRTPAPKKRLLRSWPCGLVSFNGSQERIRYYRSHLRAYKVIIILHPIIKPMKR